MICAKVKIPEGVLSISDRLVKHGFYKNREEFFEEMLKRNLIKKSLCEELNALCNELKESRAIIKHFEEKYGQKYEKFKKDFIEGKYLDLEGHEDYFEWEYEKQKHEQLNKKYNSLKEILEEIF